MNSTPHKLLYHGILLAVCLTANGCDAQQRTNTEVAAVVSDPQKFADYWYRGEGELSRYELKQWRYGEPRKGEAVLIYVTEDFLTEKQVKNETGQPNSVKIIKLNMLKKFETGIYDYSIMSSTFTPIDYRKHPYTLKTTFSSQDWCGQVFSQLSLRDRTLHYELRSYFEREGDLNEERPATYFEEDLWTRMRLEPQMLPLGDIEIIPSQEYLRLHHQPFKPHKAKAVLLLQVGDSGASSERYVYRLQYVDIDREMEWTCDSSFPYLIHAWRESIKNRGGQIETTTATLTKTLKNSYWTLNGNEYGGMRDSLDIRFRLLE